MTDTAVREASSREVVSPPAMVGAPRLRRRPLLVVLAVAMVAAGALLGVWLWVSASSGVDVVVVRKPVDRGAVISADSLGTVRVSVDPGLKTVPAVDLQSLVGKRAASDLSAGALVTPGQVTDAVVPAAGQSLVGVPVAPGLMPSEGLRPGDPVRLVQTPGQSGDVSGSPVTISGTVSAVTPGDTQTVVDVLVSSDQAAELAARAATGKVAVVLDSRAK
jgi:hypothetical protein